MRSKYYSYLLFAILAAASLACSLGLPNINRLETGSTQTFELNQPLPNTDAIQDVNFSIMGGNFNLAGGAETMLEGQVRYNVEEWKPTVISNGNLLTVSQGGLNEASLALPQGQVVNDWDVRLGNIPMNLTLHAGAYDAKMDLGGLPIHHLEIEEGAGKAAINFDTLNPEVMESFTYHAGLSDIALHGLANANFKEMTFEGGAGDHKFDFSGTLQQDATITIEVGLGDVEILVPRGMSAQVEIEGGLSQVYKSGEWSGEGSRYENQGQGPQLTILVKMSAGSLRLVNE